MNDEQINGTNENLNENESVPQENEVKTEQQPKVEVNPADEVAQSPKAEVNPADEVAQPPKNEESTTHFEEKNQPFEQKNPPFEQNSPQFYSEQKHYVPNGYVQNSFNNHTTNPGAPVPPMKKPKNSKAGIKVFAIILCIAVVFSIGVGVGYIADDKETQTGSSDELKYQGEDVEIKQGVTVKRDGIEPDESGKYTADEVAQIVGESVVNIHVYSETDTSDGAIASGVILDESGYIISNDHIYSETANAKFVITMSDGKCYKAKYIAGDQRSDISVLKFVDMPDKITPAVFADSSVIKAGDEVIAIGSPYGLSGTVTKGIVSSPARRISFSTTAADGTKSSYSMKVIQTDTALNSGNSGGALVNMYGQVVGISSSKIVLSGYEGLCFAIPSSNATKYAKSLIKNGRVADRAKLGITYTSVTAAAALVNDIPAGLRVQSIDEDSDLLKKGIVSGDNGDIITEIDGKEVTSSDVALDVIDKCKAGDTIKLKIFITKTQKYKTVDVTMLEDKSVSSYTTVIPKATQQPTTNGSYYYYGGDGNDNSGNGNSGNGNSGNGEDPYSYFFGN